MDAGFDLRAEFSGRIYGARKALFQMPLAIPISRHGTTLLELGGDCESVTPSQHEAIWQRDV
jgi:hypothetical protein